MCTNDITTDGYMLPVTSDYGYSVTYVDYYAVRTLLWEPSTQMITLYELTYPNDPVRVTANLSSERMRSDDYASIKKLFQKGVEIYYDRYTNMAMLRGGIETLIIDFSDKTSKTYLTRSCGVPSTNRRVGISNYSVVLGKFAPLHASQTCEVDRNDFFIQPITVPDGIEWENDEVWMKTDTNEELVMVSNKEIDHLILKLSLKSVDMYTVLNKDGSYTIYGVNGVVYSLPKDATAVAACYIFECDEIMLVVKRKKTSQYIVFVQDMMYECTAFSELVVCVNNVFMQVDFV